MKIQYLLLLFIIFSSCKDDISNEKYRNENYVFYQEDGKTGKWQKINPELEIELPKSHSTYFFPNGNRYAELEVIDSFPNRILKFFDKEDKLIRTVEFESDSMVRRIFEDGKYKGYHSNLGLLQSEGIFENNLYQGKWKFYYEDGKTIKQIVEYVNDTVHGVREDYWENGNLKSRVYKIKGVQNGKVTHYYETGEIEEVGNLKNGKFNGRILGYFKNGNIKFSRKYWNDLRIDTSKTFYESGQLKHLQIIKLDSTLKQTTGKEFRYFENGNLQMESEIKNGLPDGILTKYYKNGKVKNWQEVRANKIYGDFITYYENGNKKKVGKAINNILKDTLFHFKNNGKPDKTYIMEGEFIKDSIIY